MIFACEPSFNRIRVSIFCQIGTGGKVKGERIKVKGERKKDGLTAQGQNRQGVKSALDSWLMGKLNSASYPVDQELYNQLNSLLPNEASLPTDMGFDMIPNVGI
jgi:hypothetical protein